MIVVLTVLVLAIVIAEISLFYRRKLAARSYLIAQWAKATLIGVVWVSLEVVDYTHWSWRYVDNFAIHNFAFQQYVFPMDRWMRRPFIEG